MRYDLPVELSGSPIRNKGDYRVILDVIEVLNDPDLSDGDRAYCALFIFYEDITKLTDYQKAFEEMVKFIDLEKETENTTSPRLMDWEQDFELIISPVNRIIGQEVRAMPYLHWWSFVAAYQEIGDCAFATVVSIRNKLLKGKKLEKWEQEYYRNNYKTIKLKTRISEEEQAFLNEL